MIVRRLLVGLLLTGLAAPTLAAAPHPREPRKALDIMPPILTGSTSRVLARADAAPEESAPPAAETAAPPASSPSPEIAARARAVFEANRAGKIDRRQYTAEMNGIITDTALAQAAAELRNLGELKSFTQVRKIAQGPVTLYVFRIELAKPPVLEQKIAWNPAGQVSYLSFGTVP